MQATGFNTVAMVLAASLLTTSGAAAAKPDPYARADETWISISGQVDAVSPDSFLLDYGDGMITVEMDDGDRDADGYKLVQGDKVTVNGRIDDDFYQRTTIEASSVYVEKLGTYFFASAMDEEEPFHWYVYAVPVVAGSTVVQGTVTSVGDAEFTLNSGPMGVEVEVDEMPYNPLDDTGYQKIETGDVVRVAGDMDSQVFDGRVLKASTIVTLAD